MANDTLVEQAETQVIEQFRKTGFRPAWTLDEVQKHNNKVSFVYRPTLRTDGLETDFEYFCFDPKTNKVSFGYITDCYDGHMSGLFHEVFFTFTTGETIAKEKWASCWRIALHRKVNTFTLLPIVAEVFSKDGRD